MLRTVFFSLALLRVTSPNLIQPQISFKILNTENIILTMGDLDVDDENDLEMIESTTENPDLNEKLKRFHQYVETVRRFGEETEKSFTVVPYTDFPGKAEEEKRFKSRNRQEKRKKNRLTWFRKRFGSRKNFWKNKREVVRGATMPDYLEEEEGKASLEREYQDYVEESRRNNTAYKYTDEGKPEESVRDVAKKIMDFRPPKNCTNVTGIGIQAMECLVKNASTKEISRRQLFQKISFILLVWFCIYLTVAIPLWCSMGWCCCCFRCSFCFPRRTVREIQKYICENPPGVYVNSKGEEEHYNPTTRETELYEKIKKSIAEF